MKYIIEVEDNPMFLRNGDMLWKAKGFNTLVFDKNGLDKLQKYEEPKITVKHKEPEPFTINKTAEPEKEKVQEEKTEPKKPEKNSKAIKISVGEDEFIDALRDLIGLLF